ncbi:hypothetical protein HK100_005905, partial [Physocladia obscura]
MSNENSNGKKSKIDIFEIPGSKCVKTSLKFSSIGEFSYLYLIENGVSESSFGIEAAQMA